MFEDQRCRLFYYNSQNDFTPQGYINISNAVFTYSMENSAKFQFEIRTDGRVHSLQATSREAMHYWLNHLQSRRRKFSKQRKKNDCRDGENPVGGEVTFGDGGHLEGVASAEGPSDDDEEDHARIPDDIVPPEMQEQGGWSPQQGSSGSSRARFSIKQQITGLFRPGPTTQPPTSSTTPQQPGSDSPNSNKRSNFFLEAPTKTNSEACAGDPEILASSEPILATHAGSSGSADGPRISLSRKLLNKVTRHSQILPGTDCAQCQLVKSKVEELEFELQRKEQEVKDRDAINEFLRNEIRMADMKTKVKEELMSTSGGNTEDKKVDVLLQRNQTIAELQRLLEEATVNKECLSTELEAKRCEVQQLAEQIDLYKEAVAAKDHVVVELTHKLFQVENRGQVLTK